MSRGSCVLYIKANKGASLEHSRPCRHVRAGFLCWVHGDQSTSSPDTCPSLDAGGKSPHVHTTSQVASAWVYPHPHPSHRGQREPWSHFAPEFTRDRYVLPLPLRVSIWLRGRADPGLTEGAGECSLLLCFLEEFVEFLLLKCLTEFTRNVRGPGISL